MYNYFSACRAGVCAYTMGVAIAATAASHDRDLEVRSASCEPRTVNNERGEREDDADGRWKANERSSRSADREWINEAQTRHVLAFIMSFLGQVQPRFYIFLNE